LAALPDSHFEVLRGDWKGQESIRTFLKSLAGRSKAELVEAIGQLIARAPEGLAAFGIRSSEDEEIEEWGLEKAEDDAWR
jgi:hypothetical protein